MHYKCYKIRERKSIAPKMVLRKEEKNKILNAEYNQSFGKL